MIRTITVPNTKYIGIDHGNPGLDVLGEEVDRDLFPTDLIIDLIRVGEHDRVSHDRRRHPLGRRERIIRAGVRAGVIGAIVGGIVAASMTHPDAKPSAPTPIELSSGR